MVFVNPSVDINQYYTKIPNYILNNNIKKLSDIQRSFLFYIWGNVNSKTGYAEISLSDTTRDLGYSKSKTVRVRNELVQLGFIHTISCKNRYGGNGSTRYFLVQIKEDNRPITLESNSEQNNLIFDNLVLNSTQGDSEEFDNKDRVEFETTFNKFNKKNLEKEQQIKQAITTGETMQSNDICLTKNIEDCGGVFRPIKEFIVPPAPAPAIPATNITTNKSDNQMTSTNKYNQNDISNNENFQEKIVETVFPKNDNGDFNDLIRELTLRKVSPRTAKNLVKKYESDIILTYISYTDYMIKNRSVKDVGAFLSCALREKYNISSFLEQQNKNKAKYETNYQCVNKRILEDQNINKINNEKDEIQRALLIFNELPEIQKQNISLIIEKLIDERYNNPRMGRNVFKEFVLRDLAIECNWDLRQIDYASRKTNKEFCVVIY